MYTENVTKQFTSDDKNEYTETKMETEQDEDINVDTEKDSPKKK